MLHVRRLSAVVAASLLLLTAALAEKGHDTSTAKAALAKAIQAAIDAKQTPGAVLLVAQQGKVLLHEAYGRRAIAPQPEEMTKDTIFDMASLTKPMVTATCIMKLIEDGKLKLTDPAAQHLPSFGQNGKDTITIEQLLLHSSGLIADNAQADYERPVPEIYERIDALKLVAPPGTRFIYSDVGFIVLGRIVEKLAGHPLDQVARAWIFDPLGMKDTGFTPGTHLAARLAPTEKEGSDPVLRGTVHDPRAQRLNGIAGHAGLFSSAEDVYRYASMLLNLGSLNGKTILKPETVRLMTTTRHVPNGGLRTYGWDADTGFSAPRGHHFPVGLSFGHTGFTGTSLWIDPTSQSIVILLTNRVHPDGKGNVTPLRRTVANVVAKELLGDPRPARSPVRLGIDVLRKDGFKLLENKRVGLVTNHTGLGRDGLSTIDILHQAPKVKLVALFSPEHGIRGALDEKVKDGVDDKTNLPVFSLYGERRKPTKEQLKDLDILIYDIQDIGCRFYTYISTLGLVLEAAAENNLKVVVLDRPNPIGGLAVEGPVLDAGKESFVAYHRLPVRHGLTVGELATLFNAERGIKADLAIVKMEGWRRDDLFDATGLLWVNPSPNMRTLQAALLYPGVGLLETTNLSVGRGTDRPFELVGAPWIDAARWARALQLEQVPGVRFIPIRFTPASSIHAKKECQGVSIVIDDVTKVKPMQVGYTLAVTLKRLFPTDWQTKRYMTLLGHQATFDALEQGRAVRELLLIDQEARDSFAKQREKYLLY
jgi:uncharacterized protein YbbC (DUF1343 family)/CubicO group peptidase (beta-lactamase class C family)